MECKGTQLTKKKKKEEVVGEVNHLSFITYFIMKRWNTKNILILPVSTIPLDILRSERDRIGDIYYLLNYKSSLEDLFGMSYVVP